MSDREQFQEARTAGLAKRHETRQERAIRREVAEEIAQAIEVEAQRIRERHQPHTADGYANAADLARAIGSRETS
ncbi:MAG TPA: hypothetical protein VIQ30_26350 [Pseudonocardia sp.]